MVLGLIRWFFVPIKEPQQEAVRKKSSWRDTLYFGDRQMIYESRPLRLICACRAVRAYSESIKELLSSCEGIIEVQTFENLVRIGLPVGRNGLRRFANPQRRFPPCYLSYVRSG